MIIRHILEAKGRDVATIEAAATVQTAAETLCKHKIGALVCVDGGGRMVGIISERDVVRLVVSDGAEGLKRPVLEIMTTSVVSGREEMAVEEAMHIMTRGRFRHLPVCENEELVGIISMGDAVKRRLEEVQSEAEQMRNYIHTA